MEEGGELQVGTILDNICIYAYLDEVNVKVADIQYLAANIEQSYSFLPVASLAGKKLVDVSESASEDDGVYICKAGDYFGSIGVKADGSGDLEDSCKIAVGAAGALNSVNNASTFQVLTLLDAVGGE